MSTTIEVSEKLSQVKRKVKRKEGSGMRLRCNFLHVRGFNLAFLVSGGWWWRRRREDALVGWRDEGATPEDQAQRGQTRHSESIASALCHAHCHGPFHCNHCSHSCHAALSSLSALEDAFPPSLVSAGSIFPSRNPDWRLAPLHRVPHLRLSAHTVGDLSRI